MAAVSKGSLAAWAAATNLSIRALSHDPPLHRVRGLLSAEECRGLIEEGEQLGMERVGCNGADCLRTSSSLFLMLGSDPIVWPGVNTSDGTVAAVAANAPKQVRGKERRALVREVEERLARLMLSAPSLVGESRVVSRRQSEALQLQEYKAGEFYKMHVDSSDRNGYHRVATVIIYLTTVPTHLGGQTSFPLLSIGLGATGKAHRKAVRRRDGSHVRVVLDRTDCDVPPGASRKLLEANQQAGMTYCSCPDVLSFQPRQGDALIFYPIEPETGKTDERLWHGACPLILGQGETKWTLQQWWHSQREVPLDEAELQLLEQTPADAAQKEELR